MTTRRQSWAPFFQAMAARPACPNCGDQMVPEEVPVLASPRPAEPARKSTERDRSVERPERSCWRCPACWKRLAVVGA
ncbi:MAG TPA: hypothetical protein VMW80_03085 [Candidatus Dormibacteraeota bacterium]|nr:hypothetical protein [Candidatus Dormibacteraeota bacterium]